jgi:lipid II:glycine glycyltransferase (peptidoglycan interpeptide bridge formation enzyme)
MQIHINKKITININRTSILQQSAFWAKVKQKHGVESKAFDIKVDEGDVFSKPKSNSTIVDDILILLPDVDSEHKIGYVPYGPTLKPTEENQGLFLEELSESLRPFLPSECLMLRYDLLWESLWAKDDSNYKENGDWIGPPSKVNQEIRLNFNTHNWNLKKANTNILPSDTIFIDLKKDLNQLKKEMKPKTRYNINLSLRKGVKVRKAELNELKTWFKLYEETCRRNGIYLHDIEYFQAVLATKINGTNSPAEVELLIAEIENDPLAAMFLVYSGQRTTYLYGASSSIKRNFMATYALQWEAIKRAKEKGCTEYDMFGISSKPDPSHPLYGLYRFKKGFGGNIFHRMGCWDYPLNSELYENFRSAEMTSQGYHLH